jgi:hypothetical protein
MIAFLSLDPISYKVLKMKFIAIDMYFMMMHAAFHTMAIPHAILLDILTRISLPIQHLFTIFFMALEFHLVSCKNIIFGFSFRISFFKRQSFPLLLRPLTFQGTIFMFNYMEVEHVLI